MVNKVYFSFPDPENFICFESPQHVISFANNNIYIDSQLVLEGIEEDPLSAIQKYLNQYKSQYIVMYIGYDYTRYLYPQHFQREQCQQLNLPDLVFGIYQDYHTIPKKQLHSYREYKGQFKLLVQDCDYMDAISTAKKQICQGYTYEINLSRPFMLDTEEILDEALFFQMNSKYQNQYSAYCELDTGQKIISLSPECFFQKKQQIIQTFPIKGTSKYYVSSEQNQDSQNQLLNSTKEQAEHLMVVDLLRNDLGMICEPSSIYVPQFMEVQGCANVNHLVSCVEGTLPDEMSVWSIFSRIFPGGSITGAPKAETIKIINSLEPYARQGYTGCLGFVTPQNNAYFNILIRTLFGSEGWGYILNAGGGIVYDSDLQSENHETYLKIQPFIDEFSL